MVATAYMEEAAQFDWLVAMDAGRVLATGTPDELLARTGAKDLDSAFIALLPEEKRSGHKDIVIPPRAAGEDEVIIEAQGLTQRFGNFTAVDHVSFEMKRGEIFGFLGSNGCGKSTTMKMLCGLLAADRGDCFAVRAVGGCQRHQHPPQSRLHVAGLFSLHRADGPSEPGSARAAFPCA